MLDLNKLIPPGSGVQLTNAININDRGEILAKSIPIGTTPHDDEDLGHLVLLVPCGDDHDLDCSCHDHAKAAMIGPDVEPTTVHGQDNKQAPHPVTPTDVSVTSRSRLARQFRFGFRRDPSDTFIMDADGSHKQRLITGVFTPNCGTKPVE